MRPRTGRTGPGGVAVCDSWPGRTPHVRISRDGGRTYPARHARPLPAEPPGQPCTVPVYDPGSATGRMLALDLDPGRCRLGLSVQTATAVERQAAELGQLLERLGGRYARRRLAVRRPPRLRPVRRGAAVARAARRRPGPGAALPLDRHGADVFARRPDRPARLPPQVRRLAAALDVRWRTPRQPSGTRTGPEVWAALLAELAAELRQVEASPAGTDFRGRGRAGRHRRPVGAPPRRPRPARR